MTNKEAVGKLLGLLRKYDRIIAVIMCCLLISTGLNLCIPLISRQIMDEGFLGGDKSLLIRLVLLSMGLYGISALIDVVKEKKRVDISARLTYFLSEQSFTHIMKMKISYFNNVNYAEILSNVSTDINRIATIADNAVFFVVTQAFSMAGGIIGLFIIDYRMTVLVLVFIPVKCVIMKYFAKKQRHLMNAYIKDNQQYARWFGNTVGGVTEVKLFNIFKDKHEEFVRNQSRIIDRQKQINMLSEWNSITDTLMVEALSTVLYIVGANLVFDLQLSVGSVFAFLTYSAYVTGPISAILNIGYLLSGIIPSTKRYYEFMELQEEAYRGETGEAAFGDLELEHVFFAYGEEKPVLSDVTVKFPRGSKTALIGRNGAGKTTMIHLLTRLYDPADGRILLNGTDVSKIALQEYRNMVSVVSQQIYLFQDTIRNNICLYKQVDEEIILQACRDSGLDEFIKEVTLDYVAGQNGAMLSGGQRQKIALARALIHDKPILIFDEATSNTDAYSEQQINGLLHTRLKDKTVIVITHKQEILREVDQIVVLKDGGAVSGSYDELMRDDGGAFGMPDPGQ